jgi:hypothetical protein
MKTYYYYYYYYLYELQMVFLPSGSGTTTKHNTQIRIPHKITHHAQRKHSTQRYTNNKAHITHNEYNAKKERKLRK